MNSKLPKGSLYFLLSSIIVALILKTSRIELKTSKFLIGPDIRTWLLEIVLLFGISILPSPSKYPKIKLE